MEDDQALATEKLTTQMEGVCQSIISGGPDGAGMNQTDAYRANYNCENMKDQTVWNEASKLMKLPKVAARIKELRDALQERALVTTTDTLQELKTIGFADLSELVSWSESGVVLKDSKELSPALTALVSEVSENKHGVKIKLHSKLDALKEINKMIGAYNEPERRGDIHITKVTIVLAPIDGVASREETHFIDANYEVLPEDGRDVPVDEGG